jgi:putative membrane protein
VAVLPQLAGLWWLYRGPGFALLERHQELHPLLHTHLLLSGLLATSALARVEVGQRRHRIALRAVVLVLTGAAHAVLAKSLYAVPPPGVTVAAADLQTGAMLMYYAGDAVELLLAAVLARQWYARQGRLLRRDQRRGGPTGHLSPDGPGAAFPGAPAVGRTPDPRAS